LNEEEEKENKEEKAEEKEEKKEAKPAKGQNKLVMVLVIVAVVLAGLYFLGRTLSRKIGQGIAGRVLSGISGKNVNVDSGGEKVTITGEDGKVAFETGGNLPDSFPKDFPAYPGAKLVSSFSAKGEEGDGVSVVWETGDSLDKVSSFYKKALTENGWKVESTFEQNGSFTSTFKKAETGGFVGATAEEGGKVTISATIGVK